MQAAKKRKKATFATATTWHTFRGMWHRDLTAKQGQAGTYNMAGIRVRFGELARLSMKELQWNFK